MKKIIQFKEAKKYYDFVGNPYMGRNDYVYTVQGHLLRYEDLSPEECLNKEYIYAHKRNFDIYKIGERILSLDDILIEEANKNSIFIKGHSLKPAAAIVNWTLKTVSFWLLKGIYKYN